MSTEITPAKPPSGCESTRAHERKFTALANFAEKYARELAAPAATKKGKRGKGRPKKAVDPNAIVKLMDAAIKARRAASKLARDREDDEEAWRLERLDAEGAAGATH